MKYQLVVLAAFIALFGSTRSAPQNAVDVEEAAAEAAAVAEERAEAAPVGYQNDDYYYRYGMKYPDRRYYDPYSYISKAAYDRKVLELSQCQVQRDSLLAAASPDLQQEAVAIAAEVEEDKEDDKEEGVAPTCLAKADSGPCRAYEQRYYYNDNTKTCEKFTYGGCRGNSNNFRSKYECENSCLAGCSQPRDVGACDAYRPRYYFNTVTGRCEFFYYGGCGGNSNNFLTMKQCQATCDTVCTLPKVQGRCRGSYVRYYHNSASGQCEPFYYGGCEGNANNFRTKADCDAHC